MYEAIQDWLFRGCTNLQFMKDFLIAMQGVTQLFSKLKSEGYEFLPVWYINQYCLKNFHYFVSSWMP